MEFNWLMNALILWAACTIIKVQGGSKDCVNETLVLGENCQARPHRKNFFKDLDKIIRENLDLIVLDIKIPYVNTGGGKSFRFDLIETVSGEVLLSLKSQLDFLTIDLPNLSDRVGRQNIELVLSPPDCLVNIKLNDALVKNWLLCGLKRQENGLEYLPIKMLCIELPYREEDVWYLFYDTYINECTDMTNNVTVWTELKENDMIVFYRLCLNYGVTVVTLIGIVISIVYRRLNYTTTSLFLCKLDKDVRKKVTIVEESTEAVTLFPDKINLPTYNKCFLCGVKLSGCRRPDRWDDIKHLGEHDTSISGFWFDKEEDALVSTSLFSRWYFLQATIVALINSVLALFRKFSKNPKRCLRTFGYDLILFSVIGASVAFTCLRIFGHLNDPFYTLLDVVSVYIVIGVVATLKLLKYYRLGSNNVKVHTILRSISAEVIYIIVLFLLIAITVRLLLILLVGFAFRSGSNDFTLGSTTALFILTNGYFQLQKTYQRYLNYLDMCMKTIMEMMNENDRSNQNELKNRMVLLNPNRGTSSNPTVNASETADKSIQTDGTGSPTGVTDAMEENINFKLTGSKGGVGIVEKYTPGKEVGTVNGVPLWPVRKEQSLMLTIEKNIVLFYLPNGEVAINRDFFLDLCKSDTVNSPGELRWAACKDLLKFFASGVAICSITFVQHFITQHFDNTSFLGTPGTFFGGLLPMLLSFMFSSEKPKDVNLNLNNVLKDQITHFKKEYRVIDFEYPNKQRTQSKIFHFCCNRSEDSGVSSHEGRGAGLCCFPKRTTGDLYRSPEGSIDTTCDDDEGNKQEDCDYEWGSIYFEKSKHTEWRCCLKAGPKSQPV